MQIDPIRLSIAIGCPLARAHKWTPYLQAAVDEFEINTKKRLGAFIAQIAHESGRLVYVRELASGEAYDTGRLAARLGNTPEDDDDGRRYKGRGLIQITGRTNYQLLSNALGVDFLAHPELLEQPANAARSAAWFWKTNGCNELADKEDFKRITRVINGGYNGLADRTALWDSAKEHLA